MAEAQKTEAKPEHKAAHTYPPLDETKPIVHRVCIQCNSMFRVNAHNLTTKQCPNCFKG